jgi:hypothetical protein
MPDRENCAEVKKHADRQDTSDALVSSCDRRHDTTLAGTMVLTRSLDNAGEDRWLQESSGTDRVLLRRFKIGAGEALDRVKCKCKCASARARSVGRSQTPLNPP